MDLTNQEVVHADIVVEGLARMRELNRAFLAKNKSSNEVKQFLTNAGTDNDLLSLYLRARKYRPEHAWETLKKQAEIRFDYYPEVFVPKPASFHEKIQKTGLWGILKNKDRYGRRVVCVHGVKWDTNVLSSDDFTNAFLQITEKMLLDDHALDNGIVLVVNAEEMGLHYARYLGVSVLRRFINCLWFACPLKFKGLYFVNFPIYLLFLYELIKPFFPKKLKERIYVTTCSKKFTVLHENIDRGILPVYLGGTLEYNEALEFIKF